LATAFVLAGCGASSGVTVAGAPRGTTTTPPEGVTTTSRAPTAVVTTTVPVSSSTTTAGSSPTTVSDGGMQTVTASGSGAAYSMSVPRTWTTVDAGSGTPEQVAAEIVQLYPGGSDLATLADAIRRGLVLFAIDRASGTNVNVFVQDQTVSLDLLAGQVEQSLASIGGATPTLTRLTVAGRDALRADTTVGAQQARLTQFYVVTDSQTYITTITVPIVMADGVVPVEAMSASITIA
jgi:hypothetical protein